MISSFGYMITSLLLVGAPAPAAYEVTVAVEHLDTSDVPELTKIERWLPHATMTHRVAELMTSKSCLFEGQFAEHFDITVPYAALLKSDGSIKKIIVEDMGCRPLEIMTAEVVVSQAGRGDFVVNSGQEEQWFGSDVYYQVGRARETTAQENPDKVSCRKTLRTGSRLVYNRTCKTATEWAVYELALKELRRDIQASDTSEKAR